MVRLFRNFVNFTTTKYNTKIPVPYLKGTKYIVKLWDMIINFILAKMTLNAYNSSREEIQIFPQIALPSRVKSPKTSQKCFIRKVGVTSINQGELLKIWAFLAFAVLPILVSTKQSKSHALSIMKKEASFLLLRRQYAKNSDIVREIRVNLICKRNAIRISFPSIAGDFHL